MQSSPPRHPLRLLQRLPLRPAIAIADIVGKWTYQEADGNVSVEEKSKDNGTVEIKEDSSYTYTNAEGKETAGSVQITVEEIGGTPLTAVHFYNGQEVAFGGYYQNENEISLGNGGTARLVRAEEEAEVTTTTTTAATTTTTTTTAKATTKAADKNTSPKTGVAFPALPVAGMAMAAVAVAFSLRKKED